MSRKPPGKKISGVAAPATSGAGIVSGSGVRAGTSAVGRVPSVFMVKGGGTNPASPPPRPGTKLSRPAPRPLTADAVKNALRLSKIKIKSVSKAEIEIGSQYVKLTPRQPFVDGRGATQYEHARVTAGHPFGLSSNSDPNEEIQVPSLDDDAQFEGESSKLLVTITLPPTDSSHKENRDRLYLVDFAVSMEGKKPLMITVFGNKSENVEQPPGEEHLLFIVTADAIFPTFLLQRKGSEKWTFFSCTVTVLK